MTLISQSFHNTTLSSMCNIFQIKVGTFTHNKSSSTLLEEIDLLIGKVGNETRSQPFVVVNFMLRDVMQRKLSMHDTKTLM